MVFITIFCPKPFTTALLVFMKGLLDATLSLDLVRLGLIVGLQIHLQKKLNSIFQHRPQTQQHQVSIISFSFLYFLTMCFPPSEQWNSQTNGTPPCNFAFIFKTSSSSDEEFSLKKKHTINDSSPGR